MYCFNCRMNTIYFENIEIKKLKDPYLSCKVNTISKRLICRNCGVTGKVTIWRSFHDYVANEDLFNNVLNGTDFYKRERYIRCLTCNCALSVRPYNAINGIINHHTTTCSACTDTYYLSFEYDKTKQCFLTQYPDLITLNRCKIT